MFGVIVALAVREPLIHVVPDVLDKGLTDWRVQLEVWRFALFLLMILRFHLGSGMYFDEVYFRESTASEYHAKSYAVDFLSGLSHFLIAFAWSITVVRHERLFGEVSYYIVGLMAMLLYDNLWCLTSRQYDTKKLIYHWMQINNITALCCILLYGVSRAAQFDPVLSEHITMLPAFVAALRDIWEILTLHAPSPESTSAGSIGKDSAGNSADG